MRELVELAKEKFKDLKEEEFSIKELERKYPQLNLNDLDLGSSLDKQRKDRAFVSCLAIAVETKSTDFINDLFNFTNSTVIILFYSNNIKTIYMIVIF